MLSRRKFTVGIVTALAGAALPPAALAAARLAMQPGAAGPGPLASGFSRQRFAQLLGSRLAVRGVSGDLSMTLVDLQDGPRVAGLEQFTLLFQAPDGVQAPSSLFEFLHVTAAPELAGRQLYLEAVSRQGGGVYYAAALGLFSRA